MVLQPRRGYRFGPENLLLPAILPRLLPGREQPGSPPLEILDLGAGCGVLGVLALATLAREGVAARLTAVERDPALALAATATLDALPEPLNGHARLLQQDLRDGLTHPASVDLVLCNPPFFPPDHGRPSRHSSVQGATHALHGDLGDFLEAALPLTSPDTPILVLHPADRFAEVLAHAAARTLHLHACHVVHARHSRQPYRVWADLRHSPGPGRCQHLSTLTPR